jgi:penicillin amidase
LYQVNRAKTIDDIEEAAQMYKVPGQNWAYADDQGNIGLWAAVGIPIRDDYYSGMLVPGWDGRHEWYGYATSEEQPHSRNPERGWLASANNKHVDDDYPYTISHYYAPPDRFTRITRILQEKDTLDINDFKRMQADRYLVMAERWVPRIREILSGRSLPEMQQQALAALENWDYVALPDQSAPVVFHCFVQSFIETIFKERLGDSLYAHWLSNNFIVHNAINHLIQTDQSDWFDNPATDYRETLDTVVTNCFAAAVDTLAVQFGDNIEDWHWGALHEISFFHPLGRYLPIIGGMMNIGPFPMGGGSQSVNPGLYSFNEPYTVLAGASQRHIFDLSDINNSLRVIPTGVSGNFMSDHYDDQVDLWLDVEYRPFYLDRKLIEAEAAYIMNMIPVDSLPSDDKN